MAQQNASKFNSQQRVLQQKLNDGFCFTTKTHIQTCRRCNPFMHMLAGEIVGREENNTELARALVQTKTELSKLQVEFAKNNNAQAELNHFKSMYPHLGGAMVASGGSPMTTTVTKPVGIDNLLTSHALEHPERLANTLAGSPNPADYWPLPTNYGHPRGAHGRGRRGSYRGRPRGGRHSFGRQKPYQRQTFDYDDQEDWYPEQKVVVIYQNEGQTNMASTSPGNPNAFLATQNSASGMTTTAEQLAQLAVKQLAFQPPVYAAFTKEQPMTTETTLKVAPNNYVSHESLSEESMFLQITEPTEGCHISLEEENTLLDLFATAQPLPKELENTSIVTSASTTTPMDQPGPSNNEAPST